jgi:hypothetical protein
MKAGSPAFDDFLSPYEAEHLIGALKPIDIKEYGSPAWF